MSGSRYELVKSAREEVLIELSTEEAKMAGERHSRRREQLVQRAGGGRKHGVFEPGYSKCGLRTSAGPTCSLLLCDTMLLNSERGVYRLLQHLAEQFHMLTLNNQTLDLYCACVFLFRFSKNYF